MGTNYYARYKICDKCKRYNEIHIGKSSAGWQFGFHATDEIKSFKDWVVFLSKEDVKIFDEYRKEISFKDFIELVKEKQKPIYDNHVEIYKEGGNYLDKDGYGFSPEEFS